jgi:hypothetical protein
VVVVRWGEWMPGPHTVPVVDGRASVRWAPTQEVVPLEFRTVDAAGNVGPLTTYSVKARS